MGPAERNQRESIDGLDALLSALPPEIVDAVHGLPERSELIEVVLDLGRRPEARFPNSEVTLLEREIEEADIACVVDNIGTFGDDNRAGIERTLHRISAIRNRNGKIVGLTCRIGRAVYGTIEIIADLVEGGKSILIMGRPGIGKTTMLREAARVLADEDPAVDPGPATPARPPPPPTSVTARTSSGGRSSGAGTLGITNYLSNDRFRTVACGSNLFANLYEADVRITTSYRWTSGGGQCPCAAGSAFYLNGVSEHEFGHVIGLCHVNTPSSLMYPSFGVCENKSKGSVETAGERALCY